MGIDSLVNNRFEGGFWRCATSNALNAEKTDASGDQTHEMAESQRYCRRLRFDKFPFPPCGSLFPIACIARPDGLKKESDQTVKLSTNRLIAKALGASGTDTDELIAAWAITEIGPEARNLWIERKRDTNALHEEASKLNSELLATFQSLSAEDRHQLILAAKRPEVRRIFPALNKLYDTLTKP